MTADAWAKGHEAVAVVDDLRKAGRITELHFKHLVWLPPRRAVTWGVRGDESVEDAEWRAIRKHAALDIEHPVTKGILLDYVREVSGRPYIGVTVHLHGDHVEWGMVDVAVALPHLGIDARTEGEALVAALRALRDGGA